jgi:hypothetical protein
MSSGTELLVVPLVPLVGVAAVVGLVGAGAAVANGVFRLGDGAANAVAAAQQRRIKTAARVEQARIDYVALRQRVHDARQRYNAAISEPEYVDPREFRTGDPAVIDRVRHALGAAEPRLRAGGQFVDQVSGLLIMVFALLSLGPLIALAALSPERQTEADWPTRWSAIRGRRAARRRLRPLLQFPLPPLRTLGMPWHSRVLALPAPIRRRQSRRHAAP